MYVSVFLVLLIPLKSIALIEIRRFLNASIQNDSALISQTIKLDKTSDECS